MTTKKKTMARRPRKQIGPVRQKVRTMSAAEVLAELESDMVRLHDLRKQSAEIAEEVSKVQTQVNAGFKRAKRKSHTFKRDGETYSVTYVAGTRTVIDYEKLRKRLGAALWNKITTRQFDKKKFEAYLAAGEVKASDLAACSTEEDKAPYSKVAKK